MLNALVKSGSLILPIGIRVSVISIVFLWVVFALFKILKSRKLLAGAITLLAVIPVCLLINTGLTKIISEPLIDVWDIFSFSVLLTAAAVLAALDFILHKKRS